MGTGLSFQGLREVVERLRVRGGDLRIGRGLPEGSKATKRETAREGARSFRSVLQVET